VKKVLWALLIVLGLLLAAVLIVPLLIPIPPLDDTLPPEQLADPDSRFIPVDGLTVHYKDRDKEQGNGEPALVLLHGFGASLFSWREMMAPLAELGRVVAFDRPAYGLTERPLPGEWEGENPYGADAQVALTIGLMDALDVERAVLVGNSAGGTVAMRTALAHPERVTALVLVDPAVYGGGGMVPGWLRPLLDTPQMRRLGPLIARRIRSWGLDFARSAWHDPTLITAEVWDGYLKPLGAEDWDRALWESTRAARPGDLTERLDELDLPVLVVTGDDDRIVPTQESVRLASELPHADLVVIPNCGHVPHEECPGPFLEAVVSFLGGLP
jgi:pimeloyl-ACP methyl ester carboxylesterase